MKTHPDRVVVPLSRQSSLKPNGKNTGAIQRLVLPSLASLLAASSIAGGLSYLNQDPDSIQVQVGDFSPSRNSLAESETLLLPQSNYIVRPSRASNKLLPPLLDADVIQKAAEQRSPTLLPDPPTPRPTVPDYSNEGPSEPDEPIVSPNPEVSDFWFVGDSIVVGFHQALAAPEKQLYGRIGAGSEAIINEVIPLLPQMVGKHRFAVVALGTNDSLGGEENFRRNVDNLVKANNEVGLCTIWLTIHRNSEGRDWTSYNDVLRSTAEKTSGLRIVDWDSLAKSSPEYLYSDGIHIKPTGYETLWKMVLEEAGRCTMVAPES